VRRAATLAPLLVLGACTLTTSGSPQYPNSTFQPTTEFHRAIDSLWDHLLIAGTVVFVLVEAMMLYIIVKYRARPGQKEPRHVHGNTTLEILWTAIPALILATIAIPTVRTIFKTQAKAVPGALNVEVVGHQWWWEFRYPQYTTQNATTGRVDTLVTANELYIPKGRTVNFALRTEDVLHSFWIPRLGGKRDLITNHTNYLWFTPDSVDLTVLNGSCNEYCGESHANMKFRTFVVDTAEFASWVAGQLRPAAFTAAPAPAATQAAVPALDSQARRQGGAQTPEVVTRDRPATQLSQARQGTAAVGATAPGAPGAPTPAATTPVQPTAQSVAYVFPTDSMPEYATPSTPVPNDIRINAAEPGDPARGEAALIKGGCIACHMISGNRVAVGRLGPNLTHVGSRSTIAGAQFPNSTEYLARWLKNAPKMKPGSKMPVLGQGETHPATGETVKAPAGLTDQDIMDLVAYLQALK
jgi:cytochrome c oxidase subunit 2